MKKKTSKLLLEKMIEAKIEEILKEDEADIMGGDLASLGSLYGIPAFQGGKSPFGFIYQAFKDIWDTGIAGIKTISVAGQGLLKTTLAAIGNIINPFSDPTNFDKIYNQTITNLNSIDKEYAQVFQNNIDALTTGDTFGLLFLLNPSLMLSLNVIEKAPEAAYNILNVFSGGLLEKFITSSGQRRNYHNYNGLFQEVENPVNKNNVLLKNLQTALQDSKIKNTILQNMQKFSGESSKALDLSLQQMLATPVQNLVNQQAQTVQGLQKSDAPTINKALLTTAVKTTKQQILNKLAN